MTQQSFLFINPSQPKFQPNLDRVVKRWSRGRDQNLVTVYPKGKKIPLGKIFDMLYRGTYRAQQYQSGGNPTKGDFSVL